MPDPYDDDMDIVPVDRDCVNKFGDGITFENMLTKIND